MATFVNGKVNPKGVNYAADSDMTAVTFFVDKLDNLNSLAIQVGKIIHNWVFW